MLPLPRMQSWQMIFFFGIPEAKHVGPILVVIGIVGEHPNRKKHIYLLEFHPFFKEIHLCSGTSLRFVNNDQSFSQTYNCITHTM